MKKKRVTSADPQPTTKPELAELFLLPDPALPSQVRVDRVSTGMLIPPIKRVQLFSADEWEEFVHEWGHSLKSRYHKVMRCSGAGDMGRDVVAYTGPPSAKEPWDNYQCKHYDHPLRPGDIWVELGKLVYYTFRGEFTIPRMYSFVCPQNVGTTLARLLESPDKLKSGLIDNWEGHCRTGISTSEVKLEGKLKQHLEEFPFDIVSFVPVLTLIEQHMTTPWYVHRFGGGLPDRSKCTAPPGSVAPHELKYVTELLRAYSDHQGTIIDEAALLQLPKLQKHLLLSRASFYSAESLKAFSRDHLPEGEYIRLQDEIHDGIQETYLDQHEDGYRKVIEVTNSAKALAITDHPLLPVLHQADRRGICHQLVDQGKLQWVESDG